jgi:hypothetical protein
MSKSYWSTEEARAALHEWQASGLSLSEFAKVSGQSRGRLERWKRRLEQASIPLLPVRIVSRPTPSSDFEVVLEGGRRVVVRGGFDGGELLRLVETLESSSC